MKASSNRYIQVSRPMEDGLVQMFNSMLIRKEDEIPTQDDVEAAWDFIKTEIYSVPPPSVLNKIIFKIMLYTTDVNVATDVAKYLSDFLKITAPAVREKYNFYEALTSPDFPEVWIAFNCLALTTLKFHELPIEGMPGASKLIDYPRSLFLMKFYVRVYAFKDNLKYLYEDEFNERFTMVLKWMNLLYKHDVQRITTLEIFHSLMEHSVRYKTGQSESETMSTALNDVSMSEIVDAFFNECPDIVANFQNISYYDLNTEDYSLLLRVCQRKLLELIYKQNRPDARELTLKTILDDFFFAEKFKAGSSKDSPGQKEEKKKEAISIKRKIAKDETVFHKLAREGKYGDLLQKLLDDKKIDVNAKNSEGLTPLHEACLGNHYYAAKCLIKDSNGKVDCTACDLEGRGAIHYAAYAGDIDIVKLFLNNGGNNLVNCRDKSNLRPVDYASNDAVRVLLREREALLPGPSEDIGSKPEDGKRTLEDLLQNLEEFRFFLKTALLTVKIYLNTFNLNNDFQTSNARKHSEKKCSHFVSKRGLQCLEDIEARMGLKETLKLFVRNAVKEAQTLGLVIGDDMKYVFSLLNPLK